MRVLGVFAVGVLLLSGCCQSGEGVATGRITKREADRIRFVLPDGGSWSQEVDKEEIRGLVEGQEIQVAWRLSGSGSGQMLPVRWWPVKRAN